MSSSSSYCLYRVCIRPLPNSLIKYLTHTGFTLLFSQNSDAVHMWSLPAATRRYSACSTCTPEHIPNLPLLLPHRCFNVTASPATVALTPLPIHPSLQTQAIPSKSSTDKPPASQQAEPHNVLPHPGPLGTPTSWNPTIHTSRNNAWFAKLAIMVYSASHGVMPIVYTPSIMPGPPSNKNIQQTNFSQRQQTKIIHQNKFQPFNTALVFIPSETSSFRTCHITRTPYFLQDKRPQLRKLSSIQYVLSFQVVSQP